MTHRPFLFAVLALSLCLRTSASAYTLETMSWTRNRTVVMHLSLPPDNQTFQDGFTSFGQSAEDALNIWNQYLAHLKFSVDRNSVLPPADGDGDTSVSLSNTIYGMAFGARVLAVTLTSGRGSTMFEADVIFNSAINYDSYRGPLQYVEDFHRIALHEFGHVVGLDHPDEATPRQNVAAIMNSIISDIDSLQPDDIAGAQALYSSGPDYLSSNPAPNLVNLSTRAMVGTADNQLIGGFIIQGTQPATVILRAIGHSLRAVGVSGPLNDPMLELHNAAGGVIATSDDWPDGSNAATIASYHLDPSNSHESALLATLNPGNYTVVVHAYDNHDGDLTGTGLFELYDLHKTGGRAGNISTRGQVLSDDDVMIGGFIVGGGQAKQVVVRGLGPSLAASGIANPLSNPTLELRDPSGTLISSNNDWMDGPDAGTIQAEGLGPANRLEAALQARLNAGNYTAIVRGVNNSTGIGLVEIYDLSPAP